MYLTEGSVASLIHIENTDKGILMQDHLRVMDRRSIIPQDVVASVGASHSHSPIISIDSIENKLVDHGGRQSMY